MKFKQPASKRNNEKMNHDDLISMEELAQTAAKFFKRCKASDVPAKLWVDTYKKSRPTQFYLRATFEKTPTNGSLIRLASLAAKLEEMHKVRLVLIAYDVDMSWQEIDERNAQLNKII